MTHTCKPLNRQLFLAASNPQVANWQAFQLLGGEPVARKAAAAAASGRHVAIFGGYVSGDADAQVVSAELILLEMGEWAQGFAGC